MASDDAPDQDALLAELRRLADAIEAWPAKERKIARTDEAMKELRESVRRMVYGPTGSPPAQRPQLAEVAG